MTSPSAPAADAGPAGQPAASDRALEIEPYPIAQIPEDDDTGPVPGGPAPGGTCERRHP